MKKSIVSCIVAAVMVASTNASAALNAYLILKGPKGQINGSVMQKGRENQIQVIAVEHEVKVPSPGGRRTHGLFTITKEVDKSSPLLYQALANNEALSFELRFYTPQMVGGAGAGVEKQHYTVKLTNARISEIKLKMLNNKNPELTRLAEFEEVAFSYDKIEWTWNDPNITAQDSR